MPLVGRLRPGAPSPQTHAEIRRFQSGSADSFPGGCPTDRNRDSTSIAPRGTGRWRQAAIPDCSRPRHVGAGDQLRERRQPQPVASRDARREFGVRTAIGAAPRRVARQLLTEASSCWSIGAAAGLLASPALTLLKRVLPPDTPRLIEVTSTGARCCSRRRLALVTGAPFGLAPVRYTLRVRLRPCSTPAGAAAAGQSPARASALTVAQIACAVLLVITAGLLVRSLWKLSHADPGFRTASA